MFNNKLHGRAIGRPSDGRIIAASAIEHARNESRDLFRYAGAGLGTQMQTKRVERFRDDATKLEFSPEICACMQRWGKADLLARNFAGKSENLPVDQQCPSVFVVKPSGRS